MLTLHPATLADISKVKPLMPPVKLAMIIDQMARGFCWRLDWHGRAAGLVGLVPVPRLDADELWLVLAPWVRDDARQAAKIALAMVRRINGFPQVRLCAAAINNGHEAGQRLAELMGFEKAAGNKKLDWKYWIRRP